MKTVEFLKDFANRKKGSKFKCDSMLASDLVNKKKVAKYVEKSESKPRTRRKATDA